MIYAAHQPDLLPYSGFFYKMYHTDVFDLKIWDQYVNRGYQRRVRMRGEWASLPLVNGSSHDPINAKVVTPNAPSVLADDIHRRYARRHPKAPLWHRHGEWLCDEILSIKTDRLWEFNFRLIMVVRDLLGIETPITFGRPVQEGLKGSAGLISAMLIFPRPLTYLSGTGARVYMGNCQEFKEADIPVMWSRHKAITGDSIVSVLMDYEDPLSVVLMEKSYDEVLLEEAEAELKIQQGELIA